MYRALRQCASLSLLAVPLIAGTAAADTSRLFIIMDNSNSMHETTLGLDLPNPDGGYDLDPSWLDDVDAGFADGGSGTVKVCDLAKLQDAGLCFSKFCSAKCVLYNAMDPYEDGFEFGFATYNTYKRKVDFSLGNTQCSYDVLAAPGENLPGGTNNRFWSTRNNLTGSCAITRSVAATGVRDVTSLNGNNRFTCDNNPVSAGLDPAKTCTSVATTAATWYTANSYTGFDLYRSDRTTPGGAAAGTTVSGTRNVCTGSGGSLACSNVSNAAIVPGAGGANEPNNASFNSLTYYLRTVQDYPNTSTANIDQYYSRPAGTTCIDATDALGSTTAPLASGPPNGGYSTALNNLATSGNTQCTAARPCVWTLINKQMVPTGNTVYNSTCNSNVTPAGYTNNGNAYPTTNVGNYTNAAQTCPATSLACPGQSGTCTGAPATCAVPTGTLIGNGTNTYAQRSYASGAVAPPAGYTSGGATTKETYKDTTTQVTNVGQCAATRTFTGATPGGQVGNCSTTYTGQCVFINPVYVPVPGDSTKGYCQWTLYERAFTQQQYTCRYTFTQYGFTRSVPNPPVTQCSWHLRSYLWRPTLYRYDWTTAGGEYIQTANVMVDPANKVCQTSPPLFPATIGTTCPAKVDPSTPGAWVPAACKVAGRECRLRWWSRPGTGSPASYTNYNFGRNSRYSSTATVSTAVSAYAGGSPPYCGAIDFKNAPLSTNADLTNQAFGILQTNGTGNWCVGSGASGPSSDTLYMGDPYSPGSNNFTLAGSWFGGYRGGTITDTDGNGRAVEYSIDPTGASWQAGPIRSNKDTGWSRLPNGTPMLGLFQDYAPGALPAVKNLVLKLPMHDDPQQLNYTTGVKNWINGANTPLYGSLSDFQRYLQNEALASDSKAKCRTYAVVLLTDGDENQPPRQPNHPQATTGACDPFTTSNCQSFTDYTAGTFLPDIMDTIRTTAGADADHTPKRTMSFIVSYGNGATSTVLDVMARRAGTAVDGSGTVDLVNGTAFHPQSPQELADVLAKALGSLNNERISRSKPTIVRDSFGSMVYTGAFNESNNGVVRENFGYVDAYDVSTLGPGLQTPVWQHNQLLLSQSSSNRKVYTHLPFLNATADIQSLSFGQRAELQTRTGAATPGQLSNIIDFVLNASGSEPFTVSGAPDRTSRLGAVVHSTPAVVGPPRGINTWPGDTTEEAAYAAFKAANATRETRVFVGSNDGIVHAICEPTEGVTPSCNGQGPRGTEAYGFVPPAIHNQLNGLRTTMINKYTADGSFGGGDVCFSNCTPTSGSGWFSMLIGSMNKGDNSLFALDVTNPNVPGYKWTFTNGLLGDTWSPPTIARVSVDMPAAMGGGTQKRWVGLVGAGYRDGRAWGTVSNGFMAIDLATGAVVQDNTSSGTCTNTYGAMLSPCNEAKFRVDRNPLSCDAQAPGTNLSGTCQRSRNSVPSRVAVAYGSGALATAAYFGDVQGRMAVSRLETTKTADWQPQQLFDPTSAACATDIFSTPGGAPVLDAVTDAQVTTLPLNEDNENGNYPPGQHEVRPIYQRVLVEQMSSGLTYVFAGTGSEARADRDDEYDYVYAIEDSRQTGSTCVGRPVWVKRLPQGEMVLSEMASQAGVLFVSAFKPVIGANPNTCESPGNTVLYAFYEQTGKPANVFDNGMNPPTSRVEIPDTGIPSDTTVVPTGSSTVNVLVRTQDPNERFKIQGASNLLQPGRIKSWRRVR